MSKTAEQEALEDFLERIEPLTLSSQQKQGFKDLLYEDAEGSRRIGWTETLRIDISYDNAIKAFEDPGDEDPHAPFPETPGAIADLLLRFRPLAVYMMLMSWEVTRRRGHSPNTKWTRAYINRLPDS